MNKAITVQYAFKKDGKGERHGTQAERLLAAQARKNNALPVSARPPPATMAFGARPPVPGFQGPYQGQFAGALAQPPPPPGFTPQQTIMPQMQMGMPPPMPPPAMGVPMTPPPQGMPMYGQFPPPPPPGFNVQYPGQVPVPPGPPQQPPYWLSCRMLFGFFEQLGCFNSPSNNGGGWPFRDCFLLFLRDKEPTTHFPYGDREASRSWCLTHRAVRM